MELLDPIEFDDLVAARKFIQRNACALCMGNLHTSTFEVKRNSWRSRVYCPKCGDSYQHTVVSKSTAEIVKSNERNGERELRPPTDPRPPEDILKELGF